MIARDYAGWTLDIEAEALRDIFQRLGARTIDGAWLAVSDRQAIFYVDQFVLLHPPDWKQHRVGIAYYHGLPNTPGHPEFDQVYETFRNVHTRLSAVQVSHRQMRDKLAETGCDPAKLFLIPIGYHEEWFHPPTPMERARVRVALGFPESAFVVGSFQKDGVGWGEGNEPKFIKGPDIFVAAMKALHARVPELHVLLTGPARGYVMKELSAAGIPWRHQFLRKYRETANMYHALDAYVIASRQEGGPKAVLESMASGIPVISTRVGQAADLIEHQRNGFLADIGDADALAFWAARVAHDSSLRRAVVDAGLATASKHSYRAQLPLWKSLADSLLKP